MLSSGNHVPEVIIFFSFSTQLSVKFILLINVKMQTVVKFLIFIRKNKFYAQLSWAWKKF